MGDKRWRPQPSFETPRKSAAPQDDDWDMFFIQSLTLVNDVTVSSDLSFNPWV
jgi:hypothetical protein